MGANNKSRAFATLLVASSMFLTSVSMYNKINMVCCDFLSDIKSVKHMPTTSRARTSCFLFLLLISYVLFSFLLLFLYRFHAAGWVQNSTSFKAVFVSFLYALCSSLCYVLRHYTVLEYINFCYEDSYKTMIHFI